MKRQKNMKRMLTVLLAVMLLAGSAEAAAPAIGEEAWVTPIYEDMADVGIGHYGDGGDGFLPAAEMTGTGYSDSEINMIANVVSGEVGGIAGASVVLTYADGSQTWTDGYTLRMIHARIVDNQVRSSLFPSSVRSCVGQCWSTGYTGTAWNSSTQWQSCREAVVEALGGGISVPSNVYAATCDSGFASYYPGWRLWARVDWDTGWFAGTFYYYCYG